MFSYIMSFFQAKKALAESEYRYNELHRSMDVLYSRIDALEKIKHFTTLEELQDKPEDMEMMKEVSQGQRLAFYRFLTGRAYRLNNDTLRKAALDVRNELMLHTKSAKNIIPFDREVQLPKPANYLPDVLKDA